jgi:hypothetical protein
MNIIQVETFAALDFSVQGSPPTKSILPLPEQVLKPLEKSSFKATEPEMFKINT